MISQILNVIGSYLFSLMLSFVAFIFIWHTWRKRSKNSPPGSNGLPLIGVVLSLRKFPERVFAKWAKEYGPLQMVKFGTTDVVVISSPEIAHEAFAKNDCFNDRPQTINIFSDNGIVMMNYSSFYKEQRHFGLKTLREFGMGRNSLESYLIEISNELCNEIDEACGTRNSTEPFDMNSKIHFLIARVISTMTFGRDIATENNAIHNILEEISKPNESSVFVGLLMFAPFLRFLPVFSSVWKTCAKYRENLHKEMSKELIRHQQSRDPNDSRDFFDSFISEIKHFEKNSTKGETRNSSLRKMHQKDSSAGRVKLEQFSGWIPGDSFTEKQLIAMGRDLFLAGSDTTASTILWVFLYLIKYPNVQTKMQNEIDDVLGQLGVPCLSKIDKLPYVRAVLEEVSRLRPVVPLSIPHQASRDAVLRGYRIPKGAFILTNIWAIHHDEARWPEPEKFIPERHLDENGKFEKSPNSMAFNVGARSCMGQQLAKMELFLLTVMLFRRFKFSLPPGITPDMNGENIVSLRPFHYDFIATKR